MLRQRPPRYPRAIIMARACAFVSNGGRGADATD